MMFELKQDEYKKIIPLIEDINYSKVLICSVIEGNSKGKVFVDNLESPKLAYIESDFSFLIGTEENEIFNRRLYSYVLDRIKNSKVDELILFLGSSKLAESEKFFLSNGCITIQRKTFKFNKDRYKEAKYKEIILSKGFELRKIDQKLINDYKEYIEIIKYPSNFGFCVVNDVEVISECKSVAVGCREAEISIGTKDNYRRNGYATKATIAFIDYCLENNMTPCWSCWPFREESINLAGKLGFEEDENASAIYWSKEIK